MRRGSLSRLLCKASVLLLAVTMLAWGMATAPIFLRDAKVESAAYRIVGGDEFRPDALEALSPTLTAIETSSWDEPSALRGAVIVRLRIAEAALGSASAKDVDPALSKLQASVDHAIANAPIDSFLWMVLFWLKNAQGGFSEQNLPLLRMSYRTGPQEGWIAIKRNQIAMSIYAALPRDLKEMAVEEFARLVASDLYPEATNILTGPGWPYRDDLLPALVKANPTQRQIFAKSVYEQGFDVTIPGIKHIDPRPWK